MTQRIETPESSTDIFRKLPKSNRVEPYPDDALVEFSNAMKKYLTVRKADFESVNELPFHLPNPESVENKARFTVLAQIIKKELGDDYKYFVKEALRESVKDNPENAQKHFGQMLTFFSQAHQDKPEIAAQFYKEIKARKLAPTILELLTKDADKESTHTSRISKPEGSRFI